MDIDGTGSAVVERGFTVESNNRSICDIQRRVFTSVIHGSKAVNTRFDRRHIITVVLHCKTHSIHLLGRRGIMAYTFEHEYHGSLLVGAAQLACVLVDAEKRFATMRCQFEMILEITLCVGYNYYEKSMS